jgi:hypothetical protein
MQTKDTFFDSRLNLFKRSSVSPEFHDWSVITLRPTSVTSKLKRFTFEPQPSLIDLNTAYVVIKARLQDKKADGTLTAMPIPIKVNYTRLVKRLIDTGRTQQENGKTIKVMKEDQVLLEDATLSRVCVPDQLIGYAMFEVHTRACMPRMYMYAGGYFQDVRYYLNDSLIASSGGNYIHWVLYRLLINTQRTSELERYKHSGYVKESVIADYTNTILFAEDEGTTKRFLLTLVSSTRCVNT